MFVYLKVFILEWKLKIKNRGLGVCWILYKVEINYSNLENKNFNEILVFKERNIIFFSK